MATEQEFLKRFSRELPVDLNDGELQAYGRQLAEKVREEELAEEKKKQIASEHTSRIKVIRNEIKRLADSRAKGAELRPVQCGERIKGNVIEVVRLDSYVVVDSRPADLQDLQTTMFDTSDAEPDGFDDGRDADPDNVVQFTGSTATSSVGDTVHVGDANDRDEETEKAYGEPAITEVYDGDELSDEAPAKPARNRSKAKATKKK